MKCKTFNRILTNSYYIFIFFFCFVGFICQIGFFVDESVISLSSLDLNGFYFLTLYTVRIYRIHNNMPLRSS